MKIFLTSWLVIRWQAANPATRQYDIGNPIAPRSVFNLWPDAPAGDVTADYQLQMVGLNVGQVLNIKGKGVPLAPGKAEGVLCYLYE